MSTWCSNQLSYASKDGITSTAYEYSTCSLREKASEQFFFYRTYAETGFLNERMPFEPAICARNPVSFQACVSPILIE